MNFLSHFYFEKENLDSNMVLGCVLPDLVKNAHKDWNLYPQKSEHLFNQDVTQSSLLKGWKRHLEVDVLFHSSTFFQTETAKLKQLLLPLLEESPVRPSFLAHIGVELVLDHLLVDQGKININAFYDHLNQVHDEDLVLFLEKCGQSDLTIFFNFLNSFRSSRYLLSYQKLENISYALQRICMRLWQHPFNEAQVAAITDQIAVYKQELAESYLSIFEEIQLKLESPRSGSPKILS